MPHHALIGGHTHEQVAAGDIRVGLALLATAAAERLIRAGLDVKGAHVVPTLGVVLCGLVAGALDGAHVQNDRMVDIAQLEQGALDGRLVVAIGKEAIVEPQGAEEVVGSGTFALAQLGEVAVDATVILGNGPTVVVHDGDHAGAELGKVVKPLERKTTGNGAIADDGDDVVIGAHEVARLGHAASEAHGS